MESFLPVVQNKNFYCCCCGCCSCCCGCCSHWEIFVGEGTLWRASFSLCGKTFVVVVDVVVVFVVVVEVVWALNM